LLREIFESVSPLTTVYLSEPSRIRSVVRDGEAVTVGGCWDDGAGVEAAGAGEDAGPDEDVGAGAGADSGSVGWEAQANNTKKLKISNKQKTIFFIENSFFLPLDR
jgi:hypothetical protein